MIYFEFLFFGTLGCWWVNFFVSIEVGYSFVLKFIHFPFASEDNYDYNENSPIKDFTLLHIVPFCEGPNEKPEGFVKQKQKTWKVCEAKTICHICDATRIATCGAPPIANL